MCATFIRRHLQGGFGATCSRGEQDHCGGGSLCVVQVLLLLPQAHNQYLMSLGITQRLFELGGCIAEANLGGQTIQ